jgi:hypothetical protein
MKRTVHPLHVLSFLVLAAAGACKSTPSIDDAYLVYVPEEARAELDELRIEHARLADRLASADHEIELQQERRRIAAEELDLARNEVEIVEARAKAARTNPEREASEYDEDLDTARTHVQWAEAQVEYRGALVDLARAERELAQRQVEVAEARIELRKARAVEQLEDDRVPEIEVSRYEQSLDAAQTRVEMAEIDVEAAQRRAEAREDIMARIADRVPRAQAASWRRVEPDGQVQDDDGRDDGDDDDIEDDIEQERRDDPSDDR